MGSILPFARNESFDPETVRIMSAAFDAAWKELLDVGHASTTRYKANATREALAKRIIDIARRGERDPARLCLRRSSPWRSWSSDHLLLLTCRRLPPSPSGWTVRYLAPPRRGFSLGLWPAMSCEAVANFPGPNGAFGRRSLWAPERRNGIADVLKVRVTNVRSRRIAREASFPPIHTRLHERTEARPSQSSS